MHPFYTPSGRLLARQGDRAGIVGMAAYLMFWAMALALAKRELDARFPRGGHASARDPALDVLRERFARGEIDADGYRAALVVLGDPSRSPGPRAGPGDDRP
jgi:hypothetical protein